MAEKNAIYKCNICGNVVSVITAKAGTLVCCNEDMEMLEPKSLEEGKEKHLPVVEKTATGVKVTVGSIKHPMEESHFIELIQLIDNNNNVVIGKRLKPGDLPQAEFSIENAEGLKARALCNVHGLWITG